MVLPTRQRRNAMEVEKQVEQLMEEMKARIATVLVTLLELELEQGIDFAPKSSIYLAFNSNIKLFNILDKMLTDNGMVEKSTEVYKLTKKGREIATSLMKIKDHIVKQDELRG
jgi:predicted transcriptional regulator